LAYTRGLYMYNSSIMLNASFGAEMLKDQSTTEYQSCQRILNTSQRMLKVPGSIREYQDQRYQRVLESKSILGGTREYHQF
jgi:hypothetical protein